MCLCTSEAPLGWEHLLSHPNKLGSSVKANETGFCVHLLLPQENVNNSRLRIL